MLLLSSADIFQKFFQEHYQSANRLDPDQERHFAVPDLDPNCLQMLSTHNKSCHQQGNIYMQLSSGANIWSKH